jgi:hypothetical protein
MDNQQPPTQPSRSITTGAAIAFGLSAIIIAIIVVAGLIILKGFGNLNRIDISVSDTLEDSSENKDKEAFNWSGHHKKNYCLS